MSMSNESIMQMAKIASAIQKSSDPQQLVTQLLQQQMGNNPLCASLVQLAQARDGKQIESIARGLCQQRGLDFDKEITDFKQILAQV